MNITMHKNAHSTPAVRLELQRSDQPVKALAARYNISETTARKWRGRETAHDRSHARHNLLSSLDVTQEALVLGLRRDVGLSLNEIIEFMRRCHDLKSLNKNTGSSGQKQLSFPFGQKPLYLTVRPQLYSYPMAVPGLSSPHIMP